MGLLFAGFISLFSCLLLMPAVASAQPPNTPALADTTLLRVLASVRPHWTFIRVETRGSAAVEGMYAGLRHDVLLVWPPPKRQVPLETIDVLYARRSNVGRNTALGAVAGGLFGGLILNPVADPAAKGIRQYAGGAALGAFFSFGLSVGRGPWERIYMRADSPDQ
jgi:ABC-type Fe3+-siderophore transport system permease subunit